MADMRRTHRGKVIDIDLIRMKWELELKDINKINIKREQEVDEKRRRGSSDKINEMLANQEMVRQKLKDQKQKQQDIDDDKSSETITQELPKEEKIVKVEKDTPDITGRKIIKR